MQENKIHFVFSPNRSNGQEFVSELMDKFGQASPQDAESFISVGGDGTLLYSLNLSAVNSCKPVIAFTPLTSNSVGFRTRHGIGTIDELENYIDNSTAITVTPLEAKVRFEDGSSRIIHSFNDVSVIRDGEQAAFFDVERILSDGSVIKNKLRGDSIVFATGLGSTGYNRSIGGPVLPIGDNSVVFNASNLFAPAHGKWSIFNPKAFHTSIENENIIFNVSFANPSSKGKVDRVARIDYDTGHIRVNKSGSLVNGLEIRKAPEQSVVLFRDIEQTDYLLPIKKFYYGLRVGG